MMKKFQAGITLPLDAPADHVGDAALALAEIWTAVTLFKRPDAIYLSVETVCEESEAKALSARTHDAMVAIGLSRNDDLDQAAERTITKTGAH